MTKYIDRHLKITITIWIVCSVVVGLSIATGVTSVYLAKRGTGSPSSAPQEAVSANAGEEAPEPEPIQSAEERVSEPEPEPEVPEVEEAPTEEQPESETETEPQGETTEAEAEAKAKAEPEPVISLEARVKRYKEEKQVALQAAVKPYNEQLSELQRKHTYNEPYAALKRNNISLYRKVISAAIELPEVEWNMNYYYTKYQKLYQQQKRMEGLVPQGQPLYPSRKLRSAWNWYRWAKRRVQELRLTIQRANQAEQAYRAEEHMQQMRVYNRRKAAPQEVTKQFNSKGINKPIAEFLAAEDYVSRLEESITSVENTINRLEDTGHDVNQKLQDRLVSLRERLPSAQEQRDQLKADLKEELRREQEEAPDA